MPFQSCELVRNSSSSLPGFPAAGQGTMMVCTSCPAGKYYEQTGQCEACPFHNRGVLCVDGEVIAEAGYWHAGDASTFSHNTIFYPCARDSDGGSVCTPSGNGSTACRDGHTGPLCSTCEQGYSQVGSGCMRCPENANVGGTLLLLLAVLACGLFCFIVTVRAVCTHRVRISTTASLKVMVNYLVGASVLSELQLDWGLVNSVMFSGMSSVTSAGGTAVLATFQCVVATSPLRRAVATLLAPLYCCILPCVVMAVHRVRHCLHLRTRRRREDAIRRTFEAAATATADTTAKVAGGGGENEGDKDEGGDGCECATGMATATAVSGLHSRRRSSAAAAAPQWLVLNRNPRAVLQTAVLVLLYICYTSTAKAAFQALDTRALQVCVSNGSDAGHSCDARRMYWSVALEVSTDDVEYQQLRGLALFVIIAYTAGFPLLVAFLLRRVGVNAINR
jgi:hypothetical protein